MIKQLREALLLLFLTMAFAQPLQAKEGDNIEATVGDLKIIHLWTTQPEKFVEAWQGPTQPNLPTSSRTERNKPIQQFILYANCTADTDGKCQLDAEMNIFAPDGSRYGDVMAFPAVQKLPAGPRNRILMAPNGIGLKIEDGEQLGAYRLELTITDVNAKVTTKSVVHIEVVEASTGGS